MTTRVGSAGVFVDSSGHDRCVRTGQRIEWIGDKRPTSAVVHKIDATTAGILADTGGANTVFLSERHYTPLPLQASGPSSTPLSGGSITITASHGSSSSHSDTWVTRDPSTTVPDALLPPPNMAHTGFDRNVRYKEMQVGDDVIGYYEYPSGPLTGHDCQLEIVHGHPDLLHKTTDVHSAGVFGKTRDARRAAEKQLKQIVKESSRRGDSAASAPSSSRSKDITPDEPTVTAPEATSVRAATAEEDVTNFPPPSVTDMNNAIQDGRDAAEGAAAADLPKYRSKPGEASRKKREFDDDSTSIPNPIAMMQRTARNVASIGKNLVKSGRADLDRSSEYATSEIASARALESLDRQLSDSTRTSVTVKERGDTTTMTRMEAQPPLKKMQQRHNTASIGAATNALKGVAKVSVGGALRGGGKALAGSLNPDTLRTNASGAAGSIAGANLVNVINGNMGVSEAIASTATGTVSTMTESVIKTAAVGAARGFVKETFRAADVPVTLPKVGPLMQGLSMAKAGVDILSNAANASSLGEAALTVSDGAMDMSVQWGAAQWGATIGAAGGPAGAFAGGVAGGFVGQAIISVKNWLFYDGNTAAEYMAAANQRIAAVAAASMAASQATAPTSSK
ncbi:MAG: hypothetical protein HY860_01995 [Chlamydiales bacterium]|nr:hypothetical protein [Chlamydiales bacterium]